MRLKLAGEGCSDPGVWLESLVSGFGGLSWRVGGWADNLWGLRRASAANSWRVLRWDPGAFQPGRAGDEQRQRRRFEGIDGFRRLMEGRVM